MKKEFVAYIWSSERGYGMSEYHLNKELKKLGIR